MLKSSQIAALINEIFDGVERSKCGDIVKIGDNGKPELQSLAYNTYMTVLNNMLPKNVGMSMKEEK